MRFVGRLGLCYQIIHSIHAPQKQNCLQLFLVTVPLPSNFQWEKPNVPSTITYFKYIFLSLKEVPLYVYLSISHTIMFGSKGKWICTSDIETVKKE